MLVNECTRNVEPTITAWPCFRPCQAKPLLRHSCSHSFLSRVRILGLGRSARGWGGAGAGPRPGGLRVGLGTDRVREVRGSLEPRRACRFCGLIIPELPLARGRTPHPMRWYQPPVAPGAVRNLFYENRTDDRVLTAWLKPCLSKQSVNRLNQNFLRLAAHPRAPRVTNPFS